MKVKIKHSPKNYALGKSTNTKAKAAILAETQRNILAINANEKMAERDAGVTLEQDRIKAAQTTKIIIAIVAIVLIFLILKFL